ncbi:MAG: sigma-70 family RNA polymerase sigma factor [Actinomycetota bacterium]|nr:sigma-70 family RNA polymerase sigma factor [Actinomycetota bacterium]
MPDLATDVAEGETPAALEQHRVALTGYCYRMLGSVHEAEDAVQDTMVRAWRGLDRFDGRSALRTWLYRIATNVCIDSLNGRNRRAFPVDLAPSAPTAEALGHPLPQAAWIGPILDRQVIPSHADPAELTMQRESIRLAFIAALQHLPPRQRAVLILREVLRWSAAEVATLLESSEASVNSAVQRARATLAARELGGASSEGSLDEEHRQLLARYVKAFESYDMDALVSLLREDAAQTMPPFRLWLQGPDDITGWLLGPGRDCRGSRLVSLDTANGCPAFAHYHPSRSGGHEPFAIQLLEVKEGRIARLTHFLDPQLFAAFGLPARLDP